MMLDSERVLAVVFPALRAGAHAPATVQTPPREQLPPLRSLFDISPQLSYKDSHSPVFLADCPHEAWHPASPIRPDRSYGSWPQRPSSHAYNHSLPSSVSSRSSLPRYAEPPQEPLVSSWPQQSPEHISLDTSLSFRPRAEPESAYKDGASYQTPSGEPGKGTLSPKIWSGTQFFPRFVKQAEVPGEGLCYVYDNGTYCRTSNNGEGVNAHWGVTRAGKPRERLAISCIACRKKKKKCDPLHLGRLGCSIGSSRRTVPARSGRSTRTRSTQAAPASTSLPRLCPRPPSTTSSFYQESLYSSSTLIMNSDQALSNWWQLGDRGGGANF
jgi:hypothetical protein